MRLSTLVENLTNPNYFNIGQYCMDVNHIIRQQSFQSFLNSRLKLLSPGTKSNGFFCEIVLEFHLVEDLKKQFPDFLFGRVRAFL